MTTDINNIDDENSLRAYTLGRIQAASGYEGVPSPTPVKDINEALEEHNDRMEEIRE